MSPNPYILSRFTSNIPMPTLYAGDAIRKPKLSVIEVLLYNMAALLAGVAAGYDVRMSNISPFHPTLLSEVPALKAPLDMEFPNVLPEEQRCFAANTYHGPSKHNRATINSSTYQSNEQPSPPCRNDSPCRSRAKDFKTIGIEPCQEYNSKLPKSQLHSSNATTNMPKDHFPIGPSPLGSGGIKKLPSNISTTTTSGLGGSNFTNNTSGLLSSSLGSQTQPPTPSPRRKISTSSFTENLEYDESDFNRINLKPFQLGSSGDANDYGLSGMPHHQPINVMAPDDIQAHFYGPMYTMRNGPSYSNDGGTYGVGNQRTGYFGSNYFPYRPDYQLPYERDCKSYPDYSYDCNHRLPNYYDYNYEIALPPPPPPANVVRTPPPRVPQMGVTAAGHRRTPSTVSNGSNYNPSLPLDYDESLMHYEYHTNYKGDCNVYRENTLPSGIVPSPSNQPELYKNSPQLKAKRYANQLQRNSEWSHQSRDYENLPFIVSPLHKPLYQPSHRTKVIGETVQPILTHLQLANIGQTTLIHGTPRRVTYNRSRSTPMSPIKMRNCPSPPSPAPFGPIKVSTPLMLPERPDSLPFDTAQLGFTSGGGVGAKLRSSMKKYNNYKTPNGAPATIIGGGPNTAGSTPTNPTPPDSLTSDDSSYVSAKEGSISSHSRVRFSPEAYLDASPGTAAISSISTQNATTTHSTAASITPATTFTSAITTAQKLVLYQNRAAGRRYLHGTVSDKSSPSPSSS